MDHVFIEQQKVLSKNIEKLQKYWKSDKRQKNERIKMRVGWNYDSTQQNNNKNIFLFIFAKKQEKLINWNCSAEETAKLLKLHKK